MGRLIHVGKSCEDSLTLVRDGTIKPMILSIRAWEQKRDHFTLQRNARDALQQVMVGSLRYRSFGQEGGREDSVTQRISGTKSNMEFGKRPKTGQQEPPARSHPNIDLQYPHSKLGI